MAVTVNINGIGAITFPSGVSSATVFDGVLTITLSAGGGGSSVSVQITQTAHGFSTGQAAYFNGTIWAKAKADNVGTLGIGVVAVIDPNTFTLVLSGDMTGLAGLTPGQYYFVSDSVAGSLVTAEPTATSSFSNPLLFAISATEGFVLPFRPSQIGVVPSAITASGNVTAVAGQIILCNTAGGGFTVTLPLSASNGSQRIIVKKTSADANTLTIARAGADLIDGQTSKAVVTQYTALELVADGVSNWEIV